MNKKVDLSQENAIVATVMPPVAYSVTDKALADLALKYADVPDANTPEGMEEIKEGLRELVPLRTGIEKARKLLKADSLDYGRKVDDEAKRITASLTSIEKPYADAKQAVKDEEERVAEEKQLAELRRTELIEARLGELNAMGENLINAPVDALTLRLEEIESIVMSEDNFEEYFDTAKEVQIAVRDAVSTALISRREMDEQKAEQKERQRLQDEQQARLDAQQAEIDKQALEAKEAREKEKSEQQARRDALEREEREAKERRESEERERQQLKEKAEAERKEAEAKVEAERVAKEAKEKEEEDKRLADIAEKKRLKDLRPEAENLRAFVQELLAYHSDMARPLVKDDSLREVLSTFDDDIVKAVERVLDKTE